MAALHSPSTLQNPPQTFLDKKPPLLPRQSTSDVLSFTHIIANRLLPGQNVWDFFSPTPSRDRSAETDGQIISPQPLSPISPSFGQFPNANRRPSLAADAILAGQKHGAQGLNGRHSTDAASTSHMMMMSSSLPPSPLTPSSLSSALSTSATAATSTTTAATTTTTTTANPTPKLQKRRSFAQSLKSSMISLGQLLSPTSSQSSRVSSPTVKGPPHYNILVLGSDSAPLASTLYKMSSLLPAASKIRHYQEISGFFVAYFRSSGSFSCSNAAPLSKAAAAAAMDHQPEPFVARQGIDEVKSRRASIQDTDEMMEEENKKKKAQLETTAQVDETMAGGVVQEEDNNSTAASLMREEALLLQLKNSSPNEQMITGGGSHHSLSSSASSNSSINSGNSNSCGSSSSSENSTVNMDVDREEIILSDSDEEGLVAKKETEIEKEQHQQLRLSSESITATAVSEATAEKPDVNSSAHASLSVHAFSLDTTWPVPRTLAQTFWFPFAHGIIYVVDATRKNDPRGMDHLVNARHFLASLIADPHFKRKDIPVVVFANKAGMDPETCYRVDEIAEILGCEEWEHDSATSAGGSGSGAGSAARPWCVKSTRSDGEGEGLRESVEWLKSRMGDVWKQ
ncbi:hypothetical protein BGZ68_000644 [Mortierella alpina]|nr:hypothetical protein BGZ68_000644 [Mortierella alpina]